MQVHEFRLLVTEKIDQDGANRIYEAGVDDGFPESGPSGHSIGFEREAPSFEEAVFSAVEQVEAAGFEILRVEPDELVSAADVASRTGRSRQSISSLISGTRGPRGWPPPVAGTVRSPAWRWSDVAAWFGAFDGSQEIDGERSAFIAAVNDVITARRALGRLAPTVRRTLQKRLVG